MAGYTGKGSCRKDSPTPGLEEFRAGSQVCQPCPIPARDGGMLGEPGSQAYFDMLNRHFSQFVSGLRPNNRVYLDTMTYYLSLVEGFTESGKGVLLRNLLGDGTIGKGN